jgi:hypothetical protein
MSRLTPQDDWTSRTPQLIRKYVFRIWISLSFRFCPLTCMCTEQRFNPSISFFFTLSGGFYVFSRVGAHTRNILHAENEAIRRLHLSAIDIRDSLAVDYQLLRASDAPDCFPRHHLDEDSQEGLLQVHGGGRGEETVCRPFETLNPTSDLPLAPCSFIGSLNPSLYLLSFNPSSRISSHLPLHRTN